MNDELSNHETRLNATESLNTMRKSTSERKGTSDLSTKWGKLLFILVLIAYVFYALMFIYKSSFIVDGERYFVLFDDAMISMRYAKNLANGYGLVWNPGETLVEGYTNPVWTVYMAGLHLLPIEASKISLLVQISGLVFILGTLIFVRKIALLLSKSEVVSLIAVIMTAFYMPLNNWALLGMEVSVLVFLIGVSTYLFLRNLQMDRFSVWPYLILGLGTYVRFDMAVPLLISLVFMAIVDRKYRWQHVAWGLGLLVLTLGSQTIFRLSYYGDVLPNTYYLKVTGYPMLLRIARGVYALYTFVWSSNWLLIALPFTLLIFRRDRSVLYLFILLLGQAAYSAYVGGDAWEHRGGSNRYIALAIPLFFILFAYATTELIHFLAAKAEEYFRTEEHLRTEEPLRAEEHLRIDDKPYRENRKNIERWSNVILAIFVVISMVNFNYLLGKNKSIERWLLLAQPMFSQGNNDYVEIARDIEKITTSQARIAVIAAGTTPYFTGRPAIDLLGKSDRKIAHEKAHNVGSWSNLEDFRPGHMKWDYEYTIGELKPDLIVQLWGDTRPAEPILEQEYVTGGSGSGLVYYLRKDSPNILWNRIELTEGSS